MATSTAQFNGEVGNIESNVNKIHTFDSTLSDGAAKQKYPSLKCLKDLINTLFPVGMILSFDTDIDPNELYSGTWERIKGKFIWGIDDGETAGTTGGEKEHTLTVDEMPSHSHYQKKFWGTAGSGGTAYTAAQELTEAHEYASNIDTTRTSGGDQPHNNMPPYYGAYVWRRIA